MAYPIWQDTYVSFGQNASVLYRIRLTSYSGTIIYTGRSYIRPDASTNTVKLNDICADYLSVDLPTITNLTGTAASDREKTFYVQYSTNNGSTWSNKGTFSFYYDWSYDFDGDQGNVMSYPINGRVDSRMWILYSKYSGSSSTTINFRRYPKTGTSSSNTVTISDGFGTAAFNLGNYSNLAKVVVDSYDTYTIVTDCGKYALYYLNPYGAWDTFLIEGNVIEHDTLTRHTRDVEYTNGNPAARGIDNFVNEKVKSWTLNTGILSDDESKRMQYLFNSTDVYLYDINNNLWLPVVITTSSIDYKTRRNSGNRLFTYSFDVRLAHYMAVR